MGHTLKELVKDKAALILEDDDIILESMKELLEVYFNIVYTGRNGEEGLDIVRNYKIDYIISDITMPLMDGITFHKHLHEIAKDIPFLFISAHNEVPYIYEHSISLLTKPVSINDVKNKLIKDFQERV